jgi:hypothetical protein
LRNTLGARQLAVSSFVSRRRYSLVRKIKEPTNALEASDFSCSMDLQRAPQDKRAKRDWLGRGF